MKQIRNMSVKRRVIVIFIVLVIPAVLALSLNAATAIEEVRSKIVKAGEASLSLFSMSLESQMNAAETYMMDLALHSENLRRLGGEAERTQAYLDGYEVSQNFSAILTANESLMGVMLYSVPNDLFMAQYGTVAGSRPEQRIQATRAMQEEMTRLVSVGPLNGNKWFAKNVGGRTYWLRVVRYHSVYLVSAIDLGLLLEKATGQYNFDGFLTFLDQEGNTLVSSEGVTVEQLSRDQEGYGTAVSGGQTYLSAESTADQLGILYLMSFQGVQGALRPLEPALVIFMAMLLVAVPLMWIYMRRTVFKPLDSLVDTMEKIGRGELAARTSTGYKNKEFKQVNDTFNSMIIQITDLKIDSYEQQLAAERNEMAALKMQIRPHFILNCLKNMYALAETGRIDEIQRLILLLSPHLRYILSYTEDTVPLEQEMELCRNYIELSGIGNSCPAECSIELDKRLRELHVPPVSILTLVENSVKYGAWKGKPLRVTITARQLETEEGALVNIVVEDNGSGFTATQLEELNRTMPKEDNGRHIGLANTLRRMRLLYGSGLAMAFANGRDGGARVELFLPRDI